MQTTMDNQLQNEIENNNLLMNKAVLFTVAVIGIAFALMGFEAFAAGQGGIGDSFEDFWLGLQSIATGAPGKSLMLMMVIMVVVFSTVKPNLVGFCGCIVSVLVLANATTIIEAGLGANLSDLSATVTNTLALIPAL